MAHGKGFPTILRAALLALTCAAASSVHAATDTTTFTVTASVLDACDVQATNHAFGPYSPAASTALDATSNVSVYCTVGTPYTLALNIGTGGGTFAARKMTSGANELVYNLYTTAARTTVWGDGTGSTSTVGGTGGGLLTAFTHTVYGRIDVNQDVGPGSYSSTVTVTLTF
jgi:spore coat protein U domain-containing protein, fimbrial subunit CupE1/2/3/6